MSLTFKNFKIGSASTCKTKGRESPSLDCLCLDFVTVQLWVSQHSTEIHALLMLGNTPRD